MRSLFGIRACVGGAVMVCGFLGQQAPGNVFGGKPVSETKTTITSPGGVEVNVYTAVYFGSNSVLPKDAVIYPLKENDALFLYLVENVGTAVSIDTFGLQNPNGVQMPMVAYLSSEINGFDEKNRVKPTAQYAGKDQVYWLFLPVVYGHLQPGQWASLACVGIGGWQDVPVYTGLIGGGNVALGMIPGPGPRPQPPDKPVIVSSDPPHMAIDARQPHPPNASTPQGWNTIELVFEDAVKSISVEDFIITEKLGLTDDSPTPKVAAVKWEGDKATVSLDRPIKAGGWTTLSLANGTGEVTLGYLPGDVNGDGECAPTDLLALTNALNLSESTVLYQTDIDRSGAFQQADVLRLIDLLNGAGLYDPWLFVSLP